MSATGAQVMAEGESLVLRDGRSIPVRYGYRELFDIEEQFGSIGALSDALSDGFKGKFFSTLIPALAIGTRMSPDELVDQLDPAKTTEYVEVFGRSLQQAFPQAAPTVQTQETPQTLNGTSTTTSQPADTAELMTNSFE